MSVSPICSIESCSLATEMQDVFLHLCDDLARSSGFCQRLSLVSASAWVQGLVFGWLADPHASLCALSRSIARAGASVTPQAVAKRFAAPGARLLEEVLRALTRYALQKHTHSTLSRGERTWLGQFPAIWIRDSTIIALPDALRERFPASGGVSGKSAGLKVMVKWEWHSASLAPLYLCPSRDHDQKADQAQQESQAPEAFPEEVRPGEMHLFDLGFFSLRFLAQLHQEGAYFCCRYKAGTHITRADASASASASGIVEWLAALPRHQQQFECEVWLGKKAPVWARLLATRVPAEVESVRREEYLAACRGKGQKPSAQRLALCGWNLLLTNAPARVLSLSQAGVLYRVRWQIERLFRVWKETLALDKWRSANVHRIECEVLAKLIGAVLVLKLTAFCGWRDPQNSLGKCAQAVCEVATSLLIHLRDDTALRRTLHALYEACLRGTKTENRKAKPATFQRIQKAQTNQTF